MWIFQISLLFVLYGSCYLKSHKYVIICNGFFNIRRVREIELYTSNAFSKKKKEKRYCTTKEPPSISKGLAT